MKQRRILLASLILQTLPARVKENHLLGQSKDMASGPNPLLKIIWKEILWKYSIQSLKTGDSVLLSLFVRDNGRCDIPHAARPSPGLSATLLSNTCWTLQSHRTRKCKNSFMKSGTRTRINKRKAFCVWSLAIILSVCSLAEFRLHSFSQ